MRIKVILNLVFLCVVLSGCGRVVFRNNRPDDEISKAIQNAVGKEVYYQKSKDKERPYKSYEYIIRDYEDEDLLVKIVDAAQSAMDDMQEEEKLVRISLWEEVPGGCMIVAAVSNFYNLGDDYYSYDGLKHLEIYGTWQEDYGIYDDVAVYSKLTDIRNVECSVKVEQSALEQNVIWGDIWQNLDKFAIIEGHRQPRDSLAEAIDDAINNVGNKICFFERIDSEEEPNWREYDFVVSYVGENVLCDMAEAAQNQLDNFHEEPYFIKLSLLEPCEEGLKPIAIIYNYYDTENGMVLYGGFKRLEIYGSDYLEQAWADILYNNAAAYNELEDIRSIKYSRKIKEMNPDSETVWKNIWQKLEECEVMESE